MDPSSNFITTALSVQSEEIIWDIILTMSSAMYSIHNLSLESALEDDNPSCNQAIFEGIRMVCKAFSEIHSGMDFIHCLVSLMQLALAGAKEKIMTEIGEEVDEAQRFEMFESSIDCMQVASTMVVQKVSFNEKQMQTCLEYWSRTFQQLLQAENNGNEMLDQLEASRENIAIQNEISQQKEIELLKRKEEISRTVAENESKFHSLVSEMCCDQKLLALDISIEITFDIIFCFLPFNF